MTPVIFSVLVSLIHSDWWIIFIVIHLVGAYQVLAQPVFRALEMWASSKWPKSDFVVREYPVTIGWMNISLSTNFLRLTWRTVFVVIATLLALMMPFFNDALSFVGALGPSAGNFCRKIGAEDDRCRKISGDVDRRRKLAGEDDRSHR
ncbi:hypothetical protein LIER_33387 [Lithospermum erythrorhizon]|uniref:Amino acid transporter transmembrane domain-containing protein n=1 Tax=Lithospermum erythrorhizon TaxID=34254 RepID=A0AAV3RXH9_LITER